MTIIQWTRMRGPRWGKEANEQQGGNHAIGLQGYCFLEYQTKEAANAVLAICDGHRLDKNHTFTAYPFTAIRNMKEPERDWKVPEKRSYVDLVGWIGSSETLLQNVISGWSMELATEFEMHGPICRPVWIKSGRHPAGCLLAHEEWTANFGRWGASGCELAFSCSKNVIKCQNWSNDIFKWSPHGTYIATLNNNNRGHRVGIVTWGGEKFIKFQRFTHEGVNYIEFSPNEKFA